jgi:hypothetical protein
VQNNQKEKGKKVEKAGSIPPAYTGNAKIDVTTISNNYQSATFF